MNKQQSIAVTADAKSIRLDVYVEDDANSVYDVEMQASKKKNLPKRSRYYHGLIDLNMIEKGADYNSLKRSYVIFICLSDPFDEGRHIYTFENRCRENLSLALGESNLTRKIEEEVQNAGNGRRGICSSHRTYK